ncbi:MAG: response regulator [Prolixibacteraceae bacterium]|nr:response regulator [Prolixibacteraceae bacterium]
MADINNNYKAALESASSIIDRFLDKKEQDEETLTFIEHWLSSHLNKIRVKKLENVQIVGNQEADPNLRKDGILIMTTSTEIINNPGFHNYFNEDSNQTEKLILTNMIEEESRHDFETALLESLTEKKNGKVEVFLKTGSNKKSKCLFEFDITTSNIQNNRIVVYYSFFDLLNIQSFDFRSIVLDNLPGMDVFLFDRDYRYILAGGKEKLKNKLTNSDFIGKQLFEVYNKQIQRRFFPFYNKAINGEFTEGEVRYSNDIYYVAAAPIKNNTGETIAGILISQNVTKDKLLEENLIKSKEQAQRADKAKSIFLANMSHEIRTPLNSIIGFSEQLKKTHLNEEQEKLINLINNSSEQLLYLVNEIVFLFKLGMDKVYIEKTNFSIKELLLEIKNIFTKQSSEKNLDFSMETDDQLPEILTGDPFRLRQILMNLLVNAFKYTEKGQVKFIVKVERQTNKTVEVLFEVSDTGIGIAEKDLPYIFDVFEQGNKRTEKIRGGAGLGLGICKKLVALFKGEIKVTSTINKGSTFSVRIPFEKSTTENIETSEKKYNIDDDLLRGKKILLADDDSHNSLLAKMILNDWKTDYTLVKNGGEASSEIAKNKFDLILLDIHMPVKNGVEVVKQLRTRENTNQFTPVIALTANALKRDINHYLKSGFDDYIIKPFKEAELYNKLCNMLQIENKTSKKTAVINATTTEIFTADIFDVQELQKTANGDNQFYNLMIDNFCENANELIDFFRTNLENENWVPIGEKAHKAIPSFKFFKLMHIAEILSNIENQTLREKNFENLNEIINQAIHQIQEIIKKAESAKV